MRSNFQCSWVELLARPERIWKRVGVASSFAR